MHEVIWDLMFALATDHKLEAMHSAFLPMILKGQASVAGPAFPRDHPDLSQLNRSTRVCQPDTPLG